MEQFRDSQLGESQREKTDRLLRNLGADDVVIEKVVLLVDDEEVQSVVTKLRDFAEENPAIVLGALSALLAGGAVAAGRAIVKNKNNKKRAASAKSRKAAPAKKRTASKSSKRTLIEPHAGDKRYIRRDARGRIKESVDVGRSLSADSRHKSKTRAKSGSGDKGDR